MFIFNTLSGLLYFLVRMLESWRPLYIALKYIRLFWFVCFKLKYCSYIVNTDWCKYLWYQLQWFGVNLFVGVRIHHFSYLKKIGVGKPVVRYDKNITDIVSIAPFHEKSKKFLLKKLWYITNEWIFKILTPISFISCNIHFIKV